MCSEFPSCLKFRPDVFSPSPAIFSFTGRVIHHHGFASRSGAGVHPTSLQNTTENMFQNIHRRSLLPALGPRPPLSLTPQPPKTNPHSVPNLHLVHPLRRRRRRRPSIPRQWLQSSSSSSSSPQQQQQQLAAASSSSSSSSSSSPQHVVRKRRAQVQVGGGKRPQSSRRSLYVRLFGCAQ